MPRKTGGSPTNQQLEGFSKDINRGWGNDISDRDSFDLAYDSWMDGKATGKQNTKMKNDTFKVYKKMYPKTSNRRLHTDGGGKSLKKDREVTSKRVFNNTPKGRKKYLKFGSTKADLKDYDTKKKLKTFRS